MSIRAGFFNSINDNRMYNALDMGRFFDELMYDDMFTIINVKRKERNLILWKK